jgi:hypothetical protein
MTERGKGNDGEEDEFCDNRKRKENGRGETRPRTTTNE